MSLYNVGCMVPTSHHALEKQSYAAGLHVGSNLQVGALVATPGFISDLIHQLDAEVRAHDTEIARQAGLPGYGGGTQDADKMTFWRQTWVPFMKAWTDFRDDHTHWYNNMWGATVDTCNKFRQRLIDIRANAEKAGFSFGTPTPRAPDEGWMSDFGNQLSGIGKFVKNVVYVLLVLAGGFLVYKFVLLRH